MNANREASHPTKGATTGNDKYKENNGSCDSRAEVRSSLDIDLDLSDNDDEVNDTAENQQNDLSQKVDDDKKSNAEVKGKICVNETDESVEEIRKFMKSQK